jgi:hypothetical protein
MGDCQSENLKFVAAIPSALCGVWQYFTGTLMVDDAAFRRQVQHLLQRHIGRSIKEIATWT